MKESDKKNQEIKTIAKNYFEFTKFKIIDVAINTVVLIRLAQTYQLNLICQCFNVGVFKSNF